jgi:hypothetical protein
MYDVDVSPDLISRVTDAVAGSTPRRPNRARRVLGRVERMGPGTDSAGA